MGVLHKVGWGVLQEMGLPHEVEVLYGAGVLPGVRSLHEVGVLQGVRVGVLHVVGVLHEVEVLHGVGLLQGGAGGGAFCIGVG